ncbi:GntR family transcriptional regulator [Falsirhodobacter halotolerans]|uniref:GntR family transcriptional regulator n=1 Tax=Falsirhodobacter halotolerans TaxID=1146892 RepID=UPI001FD001B1|nr:GntR family transcriptional regulator [Falsirhodobacter halotolerans]MCJ8140872.1 GntR family transcriptional regulator [Falsirhodobacter halotolerans]
MTVDAPVALSQLAYHHLKRGILNGDIPADTILSERALAENAGLSRTPLRSAITRLEREGVVGRMSNGALMVRSVSADHLLEIVALRQIVEGTAAARAATFGMTPALTRVRDEMAAALTGADQGFDPFWDMDTRFHDAVAHASRLRALPAILAGQRAIARRCTITRQHDRFDDQLREHLAVVEAIAARDPDAARAAMTVHFAHVKARFLAWLGR